MRVMTSKVVGGKIEIETDLQEGTSVAILAAGESGFHLTSDEEDELYESLIDIRADRYENGEDLLKELQELAKH
jgi:hypothetical protein